MVGKGRFFVGGNWKCNETMAEVKHLVEELNAGSVPDDIEIIVAPTYIHLQMVGGISDKNLQAHLPWACPQECLRP